MAVIVVLFVLACSQGSHSASENDHCADGWTRFQDACYWLSREKGSWAEAVVFCRAINSELADIQNEAENNFLISEVNNNKHFPSDVMYWLAGTDSVVEGQWVWITTGEPISFTKWAPGEPNDPGTGVEDCLGIYKAEGSLWNDAPCAVKFPFICKKRLEVNPPAIG